MSSGGRAELYVYYRVAPADWPRVLDIVRGFQQRLRDAHDGLDARVLQRPGANGGDVTLMEVYARHRASGVDSALRARIDDAARVLAPLLTSARHVEMFEALD